MHQLLTTGMVTPSLDVITLAPETPYQVYTLNRLFAPSAVKDLPPFVQCRHPDGETSQRGVRLKQTEYVTFHPLLVESLHMLLLAHALAQTPQKELIRYALMVARIMRLVVHNPLFKSASRRSSARRNWIAVLATTLLGDGLDAT
jgi:hypothetical protein